MQIVQVVVFSAPRTHTWPANDIHHGYPDCTHTHVRGALALKRECGRRGTGSLHSPDAWYSFASRHTQSASQPATDTDSDANRHVVSVLAS